MIKTAIIKIFVLLIFLSVWQLFSASGIWAPEILPPPLQVLTAFHKLLSNNSLIYDTLASLKRVLVGFSLASLIGIAVGILFGSSNIVKLLFGSIVELIRPIPPIAWIPLSVLWFGIGDKPAYFLVFLGAFFPIFTNAYFGISAVEKIHKEVALSLGVTKRLYLTHILLPSALPAIFTGLKTGLGVSWFMVIVAELVGAQSGLGYMIQLNRVLLQTNNVIAGMVIIGIIGFLMNWLMTKIENKLIPWRLT